MRHDPLSRNVVRFSTTIMCVLHCNICKLWFMIANKNDNIMSSMSASIVLVIWKGATAFASTWFRSAIIIYMCCMFQKQNYHLHLKLFATILILLKQIRFAVPDFVFHVRTLSVCNWYGVDNVLSSRTFSISRFLKTVKLAINKFKDSYMQLAFFNIHFVHKDRRMLVNVLILR